MAFTFSISVYFLGGFIFLFCYFSPLKCWAHFCPDISVPCCSSLSCCHGGCAGIWVVGPNPCTCFQPLLSLSALWRASILDFLGVFNRGRTEEWGNREEIFSAKLGYFCWVVECLEDKSCLLVGWWLLSLPLQLSPETQEDAHCPVPLPLPTARFRLIPSSPPQHSVLLQKKPWENWD